MTPTRFGRPGGRAEAVPRFATPRSVERPSLGGRWGRVAAGLGQPFMPWQQLVADVAGELVENDSGRLVPAYREVIVTVPRQSGKTTLCLSVEVDRAQEWAGVGPQRVTYSAQTGLDGREKFLEDQVPILEKSVFASQLRRVYRSAANTGAVFRNGSLIKVMNTSESAGHGKTVGLAVVDEAFEDEDERREQSMVPAMATVQDAQFWVVSTAGTDRSIYLRRKIDSGRAAVTEGKTRGIAYFEWSAAEDVDPDDEDARWTYMPALGHTISMDVVDHARATMKEGQYRRAFMNQWTRDEDVWAVISEHAWQSVHTSGKGPSGRLTFAADVNPERTAASIAVADETGRVEIVEHAEGTSWLRQRLGELDRKWNPTIVVDRLGPAGYLLNELETDGIKPVALSTTEYAYSCSKFYDAVHDNRIHITGRAPSLDDAVAHARKRPIGDQWVWARQNTSADISPLVAATLAFGEAVDDMDGTINLMFL